MGTSFLDFGSPIIGKDSLIMTFVRGRDGRIHRRNYDMQPNHFDLLRSFKQKLID